MDVLTVKEARTNLCRLMTEVVEYGNPVEIVGERDSAVLVSKEDWDAVQETLYLICISVVSLVWPILSR